MGSDRLIIDRINQWLTERGKSLDGRPILRIVQAGHQREKRRGLFRDFYMNTIIVREVFEVREVPKYPFIKPDVWILEKLVFLDRHLEAVKRELVDSHNGTYECITAFQDTGGNPCEVSWKMVNMVVWCLENPGRKMSESDMQDEFNNLLEEDALYFYEILANEGRSPLFAFQESAFLDTTKQSAWLRDKK